MNYKKETYAVIGNPIEHSLSPQVHALFAKQTQQNIDYIKIKAELDAFNVTVKAFFAKGGKGLNVTVPFKEQAFALVDKHDESAKRCGRVNTISLQNGQLVGYNTDGIGLVADLKNNLHFPIKRKAVLLIGAGGAAAGVLPNLLDEKPSQLVVVNRSVAKAQALVSLYHGCCHAASFADLQEEKFDLVINATSSSLQNIDLPLPATIFSNLALSYDMLYSHESTRFMRWSTAAGAKFVTDGLGMLIEQGAVSFNIWRGIMPDTVDILRSFMQY